MALRCNALTTGNEIEERPMTQNNDKRLIEVAFPLKQTSIDSVHEKNVRHGHISTLHIWPARRPLAASRAALIATLLPDPGDKEQRDAILKRLGGTLTKAHKKKKMPNGRIEHIETLETEGGVLHWGRESGPDMDWFRSEIRKAYGGRAPKVLDPFSGGGAIPLEAMRLGCEVTAVDINPVAWFILKCTLEYPQKLAGKLRRLPEFALADSELMAAYLKFKGMTPGQVKRHVRQLAAERAPLPKGPGESVDRGENLSLLDHADLDPEVLQADLAWHIRAWGRWVLREARKDLARFYPTYAEYCTLKPYQRVATDAGEQLQLVPVNESGEFQIDVLNAGFDAAYLDNPINPRWVAKPTVAYLWARTVSCKACRATVPLLKTRWLAKKNENRVVLTIQPRQDKSGVEFGITYRAAQQGGNTAQRREYDKRLGAGTMSRAGATCPCCETIMTTEDLRLEGQAGRLGEVMTAVVTESPLGKEYRLPTKLDVVAADSAKEHVASAFEAIPFGVPNEPVPTGASRQGGGSPFTTPLYGLDRWGKLFTARQLVSLASFVKPLRRIASLDELSDIDSLTKEAIIGFLATAIDKVADRGSSLCTWTVGWDKITHTFARFALPITWDFVESVATADSSGGFAGAVEWAARYVEHASKFAASAPAPTVTKDSATQAREGQFDLVLTDPPYYDAIPYSDLMDFFYIWLRRALQGLTPQLDAAFEQALAPKWNHEANDGELIDDASRFGGDKDASKRNYEDGMARAFKACHTALKPNGRLVIVFAHKHPDAWETLVGAIIKAGFVVDGSWPIQTEMSNRTRALSSAALSSSVWLVCRKRDPLAKAGWDAQVLREMETSIITKLRDFWDAGIRGPDFVWAATGPALESYSRYPAVKMASEPGQLMAVTAFLGHVRRIVVDFVVGRVLSHGQDDAPVGDHRLDDVTTYYLLHRNDFGLKEVPAGPCILYAVSCGMSERDLADQYELLARSGAAPDPGDEEDGAEDGEDASASGGGGKFKLKAWNTRKQRSLGLETPSGRAIPLIDQVHKLMQLWVAGDVVKVNEYLDARGLRRSQVFAQLIQALIEKSRDEGSGEECSILERLQNYLKTVGSTAQVSLGLE
jgi:putative DNA methylase